MSPSLKATCAHMLCLACFIGKQTNGMDVCVFCLGKMLLKILLLYFQEGFTVWFAQESLGRLYLMLIIFHRPLGTRVSSF